MKKVLQSTLAALLAMLLFSAQAMAYSTVNVLAANENNVESVVSFEESEIYAAFDEVNDLVEAIESSESLTYADLEAENSDLISDVSATAALAMTSNSAEAPPFISAFLWGCIFNWVGMLIVGITTGFDSSQMKKSAWGCLINTLLFSGGYLAY